MTSPAAWSDERLVQECLKGKEEAWFGLIDKYKNLIYSIPIKHGISPDDAGEIFQQVCAGLVVELPHLRDPKSLAAWLIKVTCHECFHWARREQRCQSMEAEGEGLETPAPSKPADTLLLELEREQMLRESLSQLAPRCAELLHMLFFEDPAIAYEEVARNLHLARGSIGFIRMRCLARMRRLLDEKGFR